MPGSERRLACLTRVLDRSIGHVVAAIMFAMMLLTFCDVVGRQGFDSPVSGANELTEIGLGFVVYLGLPLVCIRREHITIGLMAGLFRGAALKAQHVVLNLIFAAVSFIWAQEVWRQAGALRNSNSEFMFLQIDVAPFVYVMSVFTFFAALIFLFLAWCYLQGAAPKSADESG